MPRDAGESADISLFVCFLRLLPFSSCSLPNLRQGSHDRVPFPSCPGLPSSRLTRSVSVSDHEKSIRCRN